METYNHSLNNYTVEINAIKRPLFIGLIFMIDGIFLIKYIQLTESNLDNLFIATMMFLFTSLALRQLLLKLVITITAEQLIVRKKVFDITIVTKSYDLKLVQELTIKSNAKEATGWNINGLLLYDKTPKILNFKFNGASIDIGLTFDWKNIETAFNEIKKRQKNYA